MVQIAEARPPYVQFELRAVEDRAATIESGHYSSRDVAYAMITPAGSKDRIERDAEEWLQHIEAQSRAERFPLEWVRAYRMAFEDWKKGNDPVLEGTDVRNWPAISPAQLKTLLAWNVRTVEDLAAANAETLQRLGMGAAALKEKAAQWLASAKNVGEVSEKMAALVTENAALKVQVESLQAKVKNLAEQGRAAVQSK